MGRVTSCVTPHISPSYKLCGKAIAERICRACKSSGARLCPIYQPQRQVPCISVHFRWLTNVPDLWLVSSSQDHNRNVQRCLFKSISISPGSVATNPPPREDPSLRASAVSPSGSRLAILRELPDTNKPGLFRRYVEIWAGAHLEASKDVTSLHRCFYTSGTLFFRNLSAQLLNL